MKRPLLTVFAAVILSFTGVLQERSVVSPLPGRDCFKTTTDAGVGFVKVPVTAFKHQ